MSYAHSNNYIRKDLYQPEENEYDDLKCDDNNEYSELTSNYQPQVNSFSPNQNEIPVPIVNFNVPFPCLNPRPRFNSINVFGNNYMNMFNANGNYTTEKFGRKGWVCSICNNFNYSSRNKCNKCSASRSPQKIKKRKGTEEEGNKGKFTEREGDWICFKCKNLNFAFRNVCNRCQLDKKESESMAQTAYDSNSTKKDNIY